jgi:hypothetical protein
MNKYLTFALIFITTIAYGQMNKLTDNLLYPRLDTTYWQLDFDGLNAKSSRIANRCQTCVFNQTDTTRGRFCFNTSLGHVQLDTNLHNFDQVNLIGRWTVINFGTFEITDSLLVDSEIVHRKEVILKEKKQDMGGILITDKRLKTELKNTKEIPNRNKRYKILDGKYLTTKKLQGYCGATIVGLTNDGFLIIDDHTFRTVAYKEKCLVVKTSIRRIILKREAQPHNNAYKSFRQSSIIDFVCRHALYANVLAASNRDK